MTFRLNVYRLDQICRFELTWAKGKRLTTSLVWPTRLMALYAAWREAYLGYYKQALRGRVEAMGHLGSLEPDWHCQLVQAEAELISEFHHWLKHGDLFDMQKELLRAGADLRNGASGERTSASMELFLTCEPIDLARLPWETWDLGPNIQLVRSPPTIRAETSDQQHFRRGNKTRVLAILGDDTGLNFEVERAALATHSALLDIHYVGWQPREDPRALKERICQAIAHPQGWDILFFAGHSNEAALMDGQIAVAPNTTLFIHELSPYLQQAQQRGLQFALFNSCSGLDIAHGLIHLGLSQVAIMREPIHNQVAQVFLVQLLQHLAQFQSVQDALWATCQYLQREQNLAYPSAYLVPSLFRHPQSVPYRIRPRGWKSTLRRWRPRWPEALAVGTLTLLSLLPQIQDPLMDQRVLVQAIYRNITHQGMVETAPPVVLVQIDQETFARWGITDYKPMNRALLADIITQLTELNAQTIGLDYLLDLAQPDHDPTLNQALQQAVDQHQVWPVFITVQNPNGDWVEVYPQVASPQWMLQGDAWVPLWHILPRQSADYARPAFSYQLVLVHWLSQPAQSGEPNGPQPGQAGASLDAAVQHYLETAQLKSRRLRNPSAPGLFSPRAQLHPITAASYWFHQRWLQPILDFSIPPEQVYTVVPAWQLLESPGTILPLLKTDTLADAIVIVAAGGYLQAGVVADGDDNLPLPPAMDYWYEQSGQNNVYLTGGEAHAYMAHHFWSNRLVVPIPDSWMVLVMALGGKVLVLYLSDRPCRRLRLTIYLVAATALYGLLSLQLYLTGAILLPWLLPCLTIWLYGVSIIRGNEDG